MHAAAWSDMFTLGLPLLEKIVRPILVYFFLVAGLRLGGKRELAQLNPFDLVVLLTLANTVQNAIIGNDNSLTGGLVGAATLLAVNYLFVRFLYAHRRLDQIIEGRAVVLMEEGKPVKRRLSKELITLPELTAAARRHGFASLREVQRAELEPDGTISFLAKEPEPDESRHRDLLARLDHIRRELERLRPSGHPQEP